MNEANASNKHSQATTLYPVYSGEIDRKTAENDIFLSKRINELKESAFCH